MPPDVAVLDDGDPGSRPAKGGSGLVLGLAAVVVAMLLVGGVVWAMASHDPEPRTVTIVVPKGTGVRLAMGEKVEIMPTRLEFRVGDTIEIRNEDLADHSVGPYQVKAGQRFKLRYGAPGVYEGYCPLSEGERYEIVVKE